MTEPIDDELDAVLCNRWLAFSMQATLVRVWVRAAMRDALAKWGTPPAVAGEPVAWRYRPSAVWDDYVLTDDPEKAARARGNGLHVEALCLATPQPTQAQAGAVPQYRLLHSGVDRIEDDDEFLSDDTTTWAIDPNGIFSGNIYGGHVLRPARRRIKGGQHGTE